MWPHAWLARVPSDEDTGGREALAAALERTTKRGIRRCGVATAPAGPSNTVIAAVWVDALADLARIPVTTERPRYVDFDAKLLVGASQGKLYVLPPHGTPFTVPTTIHRGRARATLSVDRTGEWKLQLVARVLGGPRPVLEATVFVRDNPPDAYRAEEIPSSGTLDSSSDVATALVELTRAARRERALPPVERSAPLDRIAERRADALAASRTLVHDSGDGEPGARLEEEVPGARVVGENVAHETSALGAQRALWSSVSHRANLLDPRFRAMGVGVAKDDDGTLWIAEVFTDCSGDVIAPVSRVTFDDAARD